MSAGSVVLLKNIEYLEQVDDKYKAQDLKDYLGLGCVDIDPLPHYKSEPFTEVVDEILNKYKEQIPLIPISNTQVIEVNGTEVQIVGKISEYYFIALIIYSLVVFIVLIGTLFMIISKKKKSNVAVYLLFLTSLLIIIFTLSLGLGINSTLDENFYLLAFGLPSKWNFVFYYIKYHWCFLLLL
ncbi:Type 1 glutamine amidotransferase-like domain-containing protein [uncultured Chryseobacterium sp.]|uniref:Type 1 glutamine amidotransferase-like domain-containing protein n=1 Tax=uncultured Chryseobacterium sp. TaxID=259322 RepID=UPI0025E69676|nr:Type 1 glutamine amidotransferase-like domain-containing protein [uncultured Chryseobacterium sp.]